MLAVFSNIHLYIACIHVYRRVTELLAVSQALMSLALKNNDDHGKANAAQAIAKIAITTNPEIAFPGERAVEVVRPLVQLLHPNCTGLMNYEALLALTNLASMSDTVRYVQAHAHLYLRIACTCTLYIYRYTYSTCTCRCTSACTCRYEIHVDTCRYEIHVDVHVEMYVDAHIHSIVDDMSNVGYM